MLLIIQIALGIVLAVILLVFYQTIFRFLVKFLIGSIVLALIAGVGAIIYAQYQDYQHKTEMPDLSKLSDAQLNQLIAQYGVNTKSVMDGVKVGNVDPSRVNMNPSDPPQQTATPLQQYSGTFPSSDQYGGMNTDPTVDPSGIGAQPWPALKIDKVDADEMSERKEVPTDIQSSQPPTISERQVAPIK